MAAVALEDLKEKLESVSDATEQELFPISGTAIGDRLQDGVPDMIALLSDAGIKLWVLTMIKSSLDIITCLLGMELMTWP